MTFYACRATLGRYLRPDQVNGACEELHEHITGMTTTEHAKKLKGEGKSHPSNVGEHIASKLKSE